MVDLAAPRTAPVWDELDDGCHAHGVNGPEAFARRFGVHPAMTNPAVAVELMRLPSWVFDIWLPNAGRRGIVAYIPAAVAAYGRIVGVVQRQDETRHEYNARIQARWQEGASHG
jgi:hypothetical protein